eukprot:Phypoly_transcript_07836.p1 GENE.Phypoly_transcript_07836~~Phypoly_transcript_07836.p1  ORF type:complete len:496 (+),score=82.82 Phypoly_transcript_07836:37-1488(+)
MENKSATTVVPPKRTLLVVDGSYLMISARKMGLNIDFIKLVRELERLVGCEFYEKWFLNGGEGNALNSPLNNMLRAAPPSGPQFRVKILPMKMHTSFCKTCKQNVDSRVQKGVDVSIATLILKHSFQNLCDQVVLIAGDGDFYEALSTAKDELRKDIVLVGFQDFTLSLDLQQLANKVIWMNGIIDLIRDIPVQPLQAQPISSQLHILPQVVTSSPSPTQQPSQAHSYPQQVTRSPVQVPPQQPLQHQAPTPQNLLHQQQQTMQQQFLQQQAYQQKLAQQQQIPQQVPQQKPVTWPCPICTFANQPLSSYCEICHAPRPNPTPSVTPLPTPTPVPTRPTPARGITLPTITPTHIPTPLPAPMPTAMPTPMPTPTHTPVPPTPVPAPNPFFSAPTPTPTFLPPTVPGASNFYGIVSNPPSRVVPQPAVFPTPQPTALPASQPTGTNVTPSKLPAVDVTPEGLYPCPLCTYHRKSNSTCEMCGYS